MEQDTEMLIGTPKKYSKEMLLALGNMFNERGDVRRAYLAWVKIGGSPAQYLFGIETDGEPQAIFQAAGVLAEKYFKLEEQFGFFHIHDKVTSDVFDVIEPFYER